MNTVVKPHAGNARPFDAHVIELTELHEDTHAAAAAIVSDDNPLHMIKTKLQVSVGTVGLTVGELLGAREHQILRLDRLVEEPVDLLLEGSVVARGQLVAVDGHFAIRITDLPVPLKA